MLTKLLITFWDPYQIIETEHRILVDLKAVIFCISLGNCVDVKNYNICYALLLVLILKLFLVFFNFFKLCIIKTLPVCIIVLLDPVTGSKNKIRIQKQNPVTGATTPDSSI